MRERDGTPRRRSPSSPASARMSAPRSGTRSERRSRHVDARPEAEQDGRMTDLASLECVPCKGGVPPLEGEELDRLLDALGGEWRLVEGHHLQKDYRFKNFRDALDFTDRVG